MELFKNFNIDEEKTPTEITGVVIGKYEFETSLIENARKFSNMPLKSIPDEGLRLLLGQNLYLEVVVPATICFLSVKPFAGGDFEDGALIRTLFLRVDKDFWKTHPKLLTSALEALRGGRKKLSDAFLSTLDEEELSFLSDAEENYSQAEKESEKLTINFNSHTPSK